MEECRGVADEELPITPLSYDNNKVVVNDIVTMYSCLLQFVLVTRCDMERLVTEVMQMKEFLPKVCVYSY